jgi:hypothetical protein
MMKEELSLAVGAGDGWSDHDQRVLREEKKSVTQG